MSAVFIFVGYPGCGKGTQALFLARRLDIPYLSTGDECRRQVEEDTPLGRFIAPHMGPGGLVPDELMLGKVAPRLIDPQPHGRPYVLDGLPRTGWQYAWIRQTVQGCRGGRICVVHIDVSRQRAFEQLHRRNRAGETGAVIDTRLDIHEGNWPALMEMFEADMDLGEIDFVHVRGDSTPEAVHAEILARLPRTDLYHVVVRIGIDRGVAVRAGSD